MRRPLRWQSGLGVLPLLLGMAGCTGDSPTPADQFKAISDGKKAKLTELLEGRQSRLEKYKATVTDELDVEKRGDHTHVGRIEFQYAATRPKGEGDWRYLATAEAEYHFSAKQKRWVLQGCFSKGDGGPLELKDGLLVTFAEVKAIFAEEPG